MRDETLHVAVQTFYQGKLINTQWTAIDKGSKIVKVPVNTTHTSEYTVRMSFTKFNSFYEDDWVQEYKSVSVTTIHAGKSMTSLGKDDMLSGDQKKLLHHSDPGTEITIDVKYLPKNDLSSNEIKTNSFSFIVNPDKAASFEGGVEKLNAHFYEKAISKIDPDIFVDYTLAAVIFTVDENGEIINPRMFEPFKDGEVETLLLNSVKSMPCWIPAEYDNGLKVEQEFVLLVGNMANCNVYSLHIRKEKS